MEPTSEAEVTAFEHWLQADSAHAQAYEEVESISSLGERLPRRLLAKSSARTPARLRPAFGLALVAACLLAAGLCLTNPGIQPAYPAVSHPNPSVRHVRLGDGTRGLLTKGPDIAAPIEEHPRTCPL